MIQAKDLQTEYFSRPIGVDEPAPRFGWRIAGTAPQHAYRIEVTDAAGQMMWDSGKVAADGSRQIGYAGTVLQPKSPYRWRVMLWDDNDRPGDWSEYAGFETGFMGEPWGAEWICGSNFWSMMAPPTRFRREFALPARPLRARLYATALGVYWPTVNGRTITENCMMPGYTAYMTRIQYQAYDITPYLAAGMNAIGVEVADGWFKGAIARLWNAGLPPYGDRSALLARIEVECADGSCVTVVSDSAWHYSDLGPRRASDIYHGEIYDSRLAQPGWDAPGYDGSGWFPARTIEHRVRLDWNSGLPVRRTEIRKPKAVTQPRPGCWVVDFGQNMVGRERLRIAAPKDAEIVVRHGEMLQADGNLYTENLRSAVATTTFISNGEPAVFEAEFTFYGFRYVEITGWPGAFDPADIEAVVLHSDMTRTGRFECSNPLLNQLYSNVIWGNRDNYLDIPTDCPQRDERQGWTGDAQVFIRAAAYNYNVAPFFVKWIEDLNLSLLPNGDYPPYAPYSQNTWGTTKGAAGWADAGIICPWTIYLFYGDTRILERHYDTMLAFIRGMERDSDGLIRCAAVYKDWLNINADTPEDLISTAYFAYSTHLMAKIARVLGRLADADALDDLFVRIRAAYQGRFLTPDGELTAKTQTAAILTLYFELAPEHLVDKLVDFLVEDVVVNRGTHLSTGFLGTPYLAHVLSDHGRADIAYALVNQTTFPSWLYPVTQGATTIWERWNSWTKETGFGDVGMNSFNHYAYGAIADWFYGAIAGIRPDERHPGFTRFTLAPIPGGGLTHANAEFDAPAGRIVSGWKRIGNEVEFHFEIPAGAVAELRLPVRSWDAVEGAAAWRSLPGGARELRSGNYTFRAVLSE